MILKVKEQRGGSELGTWDSCVMVIIDAGRELLEIFAGRFIGNILKYDSKKNTFFLI